MPAIPDPAATVIVLRDAPGGGGPEVLMLERHASSAFLPDMYVFPGGRVEDADRALSHRLAGLSPESARRAAPSVDPELALGFFVAAIRETFEECGLLLARRRGDDALLDPGTAERLAVHRLDVQAGQASFRALVEDEDLELAADRLRVHAHWITPEPVPRRFDTLFFSALAPPGQLAAHDGVELTNHVWIRPAEALRRAQAGAIQLIFPTLCNLETLVGFESARDALAASHARPVVPVLPRIVQSGETRRLEIPVDAGYPTTTQEVGAPG